MAKFSLQLDWSNRSVRSFLLKAVAQTAISFETIRVFDFFIFDLSLHAISKLYAETIQVFNIFFFDLISACYLKIICHNRYTHATLILLSI